MKHERSKFILFFGDVFLLYFSLFLTLLVEYRGIPIFPALGDFFLYSSLLFLIWLFLLFIFDFYSFKLKTGSFNFYRYFFIFLFLSIFSGILYFYLQPELVISPKTILFLQVFLFGIFFLIWRFLFDFAFKKSVNKEKIIFLGSGSELEEVINYLNKFSSRYKVVGLYDKIEDLDKIEKIIEKEKANKIIISDSFNIKQCDLEDIFSFFPGLKIEGFNDFYEINIQKIPFSSFKDLSCFESFSNQEEKAYIILKKSFDIFFSFIGVLILFVFYPFIAFAIKIDSPGPVFFVQKRIGKGRKIFRSYKFRSMVSSKEENVKVWREKDQKEITKVGKFLRLTHIDELPQLLNILKGDISFVGPRQEWQKLGEKFEKEVPFYFLRYKVNPGLTGWAQINIPPSISIEQAREKFQYDLYYIKHKSFLFDMVIFLKSLRKIFG